MNNREYEQCIVKILFNIEEEKETRYASGVIVNPFESSDYLYIFTAKHTFENKIRDKEYSDDIQTILFDDEYIKSNLIIDTLKSFNGKNSTSNFYPTDVDIVTIIQLEDKELDLLIFEICIDSIELDFCPLPINKRDFKEAIVIGFPKVRDNLIYEYSSKFYRKYADEIHFEIKSYEDFATKDTDEYNAIKGISGGAVFIERNEEIYLAGIEIAYEKPKSFKCIDLQAIYQSIDSILKSRTNIITIPIDLDSGKSFDIEFVEVKFPDKSLYISKYPITYSQYDLYLEANGYSFKSSIYTAIEKEQYPVVNISWNEIEKYYTWLSKVIQKKVGLLSSRDWNFIVKNNVFISDLEQYCIFSASELQPINSVDEDIFGLSDIVGNIYEWCSDGDEQKKYIKGIAFSDNLKDLNEVLEEKTMVRKSTKKNYIGFRIAF